MARTKERRSPPGCAVGVSRCLEPTLFSQEAPPPPSVRDCHRSPLPILDGCPPPPAVILMTRKGWGGTGTVYPGPVAPAGQTSGRRHIPLLPHIVTHIHPHSVVPLKSYEGLTLRSQRPVPLQPQPLPSNPSGVSLSHLFIFPEHHHPSFP